MFSSPVNVLPPFSLATQDKICGDSSTPNDDSSLFMTMTALLYKRWPNLKIMNKVFRSNGDRSLLTQEINGIAFLWYGGTTEDPEETLPPHKFFPDHSSFLKEKLGQDIWIEKIGENKVAIFFNIFNLSLYHAVQIFIPMYFRSFFDEQPLTEVERNLLLALSKTSDVNYKKEMQNLLEDADLKRFLLSNELFGFERLAREKKYNAAIAEFNDLEHEMTDYLERYRQAYNRSTEVAALASGYKQAMESVEEHTEFEEYLYENKLLSDIHVEGSEISFVVKTFVDPYLPDDWDSLSRRGSIFRGHDSVGNLLDDEDNLKLLLDAIFSRDHCLKLKICGFIKMDYYGSTCTSAPGYNFESRNPNLKNYVPNAHLHKHNCFGRNMDDILAQMRDGDMIGAVECCINVVKRINVSESPTFIPFIEYLKRNKGKCIVSDDGREMTCKEAVEYLKEKNHEATPDGNGEADVA